MNIVEVIGNPHHNQLVRLVAERGHTNIEGLAQLLDVSTQTACQDIRRLSGQNLITRHRGGARHVSSVMNTAFEQRELSLTAEKRAIAEVVIDYLPERCTVFITIGTTIEAIAKALLNRRNLCIITNSLRVAQVLYKDRDIEAVVSGGTLRTHSGEIIGSGAMDLIEDSRADYLITSIDAIEYDGTLLEFDVNEALVARTTIKHAWNMLLVTDHMKFTTSAAISIGNARNVRAFFTNAPLPNSFCQLLSEENVELVVAEQEVSWN